MSQKKHVILPRSFTTADADSFLARSVRESNSDDRFPRLTKTEAHDYFRAGRIEPLGSSGKVWQWSDDLPARSSTPTEGGRVSLEIPFALRSFMETEMSASRRPAWSLSW